MKEFSDAQLAMKAAVRRAVAILGGPGAASALVRVDAPRLSRYGNYDAPEFAPIDVALALDAEIVKGGGHPVVATAFVEMLEFGLVPRDVVAADQAMSMLSLAGGVAKESGEFVSMAIDASSDGKITPCEARLLDAAAAELAEKVTDIRALARGSMIAGSR